MALRSSESPPLLERDRAPLRAAVAATGAMVVTAIWLCLLDRVGVVLMGGNAWCGAKAVWLMFSCHAATAAPVVAIFFAFRSLTPGVSRGKRLAIPIAGAITGFVALRILFLELPLNNVIPMSVALAMPFVGALLAGLATTLRTAPKGRRWIIGGAAGLSIFSGVIDATFFPTLVAASHVRAHAVTVVAAVVGIGLPAGVLLSERSGRWVAAAGAAPTLAAASGIWVTLTASRGLVAAVSPPIARLLALLPATAPPGVLRLALSAPDPPGASRGPRVESRPGAARSVILITVDALRADALRPAPGRGSYMFPGDTPFLDRWMERATWFDNAISQGTSTVDAMRSLMRGINSGDEHPAADIPAVAQHLGLRSVAVVPAFLRNDSLFQTGIERFERAEFYDQRRQEQQVDLVEQVIGELEGDRFFLWTHFICTHAPYYSLSGPREQQFFIPPTQVDRLAAEYREAVRWLDAQLARMFRALEHKGLRGSTLVVLTADHGEHIGDGLLIGHGDALHESDVRVPLVFDVPGQAAATVNALVGSRDVLPTIIEILGGVEEPSHRGWSLLPLLHEHAPHAPRIYPVRGALRAEYGLLTEREILVYSPALGAFQYFLRPPGVTSGSGDELGRDRASDEALMALLAGFEPAPFAGELKDTATSRLLAHRIGALSGSEARSSVDALLRLVQDANANTAEMQAALRKAFSATSQLETKLKILAGAFAEDEAYWGAALVELLLGARGSPREHALVSAVERLGLAGKVSTLLGIVRLAELRGEADREVRKAWLSLLGASPREVELVPELTALSETLDPRAAEPRELLLLLRAVAALTLAAPRPTAAARLAAWVRPLKDDPRERIASAACAALGAVGSGEDVESMKRLVASTRRAVVRRAAVRASVRIQGSLAIDSLKAWAGDPVLAPTALGQLAHVGDPAALEWAQRELSAQPDTFRGELFLQTIVDLQRRLLAPAN